MNSFFPSTFSAVIVCSIHFWIWKYFWGSLSSIANVLSVWKEHFSIFSKFLSNDVETIFWESKSETSRPIKFKVGCRKFFRKCFWSDLEIKNECSELFDREIFGFLHILSDEVETILWESKAKHQKLFESKFYHSNLLRKWFRSFKNQYCGHLKIAFFRFLQDFDWQGWNRFLGMWGKIFKTI